MIFAEQILSDFVDKITGRNLDRVVGANPDDEYFVGKLSPIGDVENNDLGSMLKIGETSENSLISKVNVSQMSMDFYISKDDINKAELEIKIRGDFYYRVLPSYEEQKDFYLKEVNKKIQNRRFEDTGSATAYFMDNIDNKNIQNLNKSSILPLYEKFSLDDLISLNIRDHFKEKDKPYYRFNFRKEINHILDKEIDEIMAKENIYKVINEDIRVQQLSDDAAYDNFINEYISNETPRPTFDLDIQVEFKLMKDNRYRVSVGLTNYTRTNELTKKFKEQPAFVPILFNSGIDLSLGNVQYLDIELDYFNNDYKYDKKVKGIGFNCSLEYDEEKNILSTTNIPKYYQKRLKTNQNFSVRFDDLIQEPITTLNNVIDKMEAELKRWKLDYENRKENLVSEEACLEGAQKSFLSEIQGFRIEIDRFKYGIEQIKNRDMVRKAFINMNKAFKNTSSKYDSWRLFQIVFIVSIIPDIIVNHYGEDDLDKSLIDEVDLLYFPTGGGKTEAFIGCIVFTLFFDRLRGKSSGVSSMIKYPLRLLSIQQIERLANVLAAAEVIRQESDDLSGDRFSLGYYVGDNNTPNSLDGKKLEHLLSLTQEELDDELRIMDLCPFCKQKSINVKIDVEKHRINHICGNGACLSEGVLPLYIVDREIYRYLPSVIISTIDKIASVGFQSNFRNILGEVRHRCPIHGYTSKKTCTEKDICMCDTTEFEEIELLDPAPTLMIQDEIHLIRESLGTFDSHYETLIQYLIGQLNSQKKKVKIIGATATISNYDKHIGNLYNKGARMFPAQSPYIGKNFYSYTDDDDVNRIIISFAPFGRAILNSVVFSLKYLRDVVYDYYKDISKLRNIPGMEINDDNEAFEILKDYWIFLQYSNVKIDGNRVINALDNIISPKLLDEGKPKFEVRKMTGDETFQDVRRILAEIENNDEVFEGINLISATSMISHGVDADRFNMMMFFGMPGNTAEYIQAYSRVGRKHPGIVIDIIRPTREKDNSYLKHFVKFHEFKDILVEPVPINRWATNAVEKTLSGIFAGILMYHYDLKYQYDYGNLYNMKVLKTLIENGKIDKETIINDVKEAYGCILDDGDSGNPSYNYVRFIEDSLNKIFHGISDRNFNDEYYYLGGKVLPILDNRLNWPMRSLRFTEKNVNIELR